MVLVTGAGGGIGAATSRVAAACGADLAIVDRDTGSLDVVAEELRSAERLLLAEPFDVRDDTAAGSFVKRIDELVGRVDVLVNNVGGTFRAPFLELSQNAESALVAQNFTQVTRLTRLVVPLMPPGGTIVNVTSIEAHQAAPGFAVYGAMKSAISSLTASLALELGPSGVRVNAVAPDAVPTAGDLQARETVGDDTPWSPATRPPVGHEGTPEDVAHVIVFLASPLARFVTGMTVHVDGGTHAAGGWHVRG